MNTIMKDNIRVRYITQIVAAILTAIVLITTFTGCSHLNAKDEETNQATQSSNDVLSQNTSSQNTSVQDDGNAMETYFTRKDGNLDQVLINQINQAQTNLDVAIYCFTRTNIADAIVAAADRGVTVRVMTDSSEAKTKYQKIIMDKLVASKIPVKENAHAGIMHLKVTIVDDKAVLCGSYNYTDGATKDNDENLVVIRQNTVINEYTSEFDAMWNNTHDYKNYAK